MNIVQFLLGMFRGHNPNQQVEEVKEVGRQHSRVLVQAYITGFEEETSRLFSERQQRFNQITNGTREEQQLPVIEGEYEVKKSTPKKKGVKKSR